MAVHNDWYVQLITLPVSRQNAHDTANDLSCWHLSLSYTIGSTVLPQNEAGLRHYLGTILRADESLISTNIGLKTSNDLAFVSRGRSIKCVLCDLYYVSNSIAKRLAEGCPCMLVPYRTVSSGSSFCFV